MPRYLIRRLLLTIPVLLGVATLVFALIHLVPGDPAQAMLGEAAPQADVLKLRHSLGLDQPLLTQYRTLSAGLVRGDLGTSFRYNAPVTAQIRDKFPNTAHAGACGHGRRDSLRDPARHRGRGVSRHRSSITLAMTIALAGISMPNFWLGPLLAILFAVRLGWLPVSGIGGLSHLVLPAVTLGAALAAILARMTRASVLEELRELYVLAARARGLSRRARGRPPRLPQQPDPGRDDHRTAVRRGADGHHHHRNDLRVAGHRAAADSGDQLPRLPARAGLHPVHLGDVRGDEPAHRSDLRIARSADPVRLT